MLLLAVASGNFPLAQLVERLDTQTEGPWFESLQWRLFYRIHLQPTKGLGVFLTQEYKHNPVRTCNSSTARGPQLRDVASLEGGVCSSVGIKCSYWNFPLAQLVECLDTQTEGPWFESLQWRLFYLLHNNGCGMYCPHCNCLVLLKSIIFLTLFVSI